MGCSVVRAAFLACTADGAQSVTAAREAQRSPSF